MILLFIVIVLVLCLLQLVLCADVITTIAGSVNGYSGDGGAATSALIKGAEGVAIDSLGNVLIADTYNHCIRKITVSTGIITTIAGTGTSSFSGDGGPATSATFNTPTVVALDLSGSI